MVRLENVESIAGPWVYDMVEVVKVWKTTDPNLPLRSGFDKRASCTLGIAGVL